jgi:hypothetical protein
VKGGFCVSILLKKDGVRNIPLSTDPDMETRELRKIFKVVLSDYKRNAVRIIEPKRRRGILYWESLHPRDVIVGRLIDRASYGLV